jgi:hypothetical protein
MFIATPEKLPELQLLHEEHPALERLDGAEAVKVLPLLSADRVAGRCVTTTAETWMWTPYCRVICDCSGVGVAC